MKLFFFLVFLLSGFLFIESTHGLDDCSSFYEKNKASILQSRYLVSNGYIYVAGMSPKVGSDDASLELAESDSFYQLTNLKRAEVHAVCSRAGFGDIFANLVFKNLETFHAFKFTASNRVELAHFIEGKYAYYVAAYKVSDVVFSDTVPVTWERIYEEFKNNPGKRDEFVFYEIIPEKDLPAMLESVERNIAAGYGKNFSLMFMGKDVSPVDRKIYDAAKSNAKSMTSNTGLKKLILTANVMPYDEHICSLMAEKFSKKQMPRCAAAMKRASAMKDKQVVFPEKSPDAASKESVVKTDVPRNAGEAVPEGKATDEKASGDVSSADGKKDESGKETGGVGKTLDFLGLFY